MAVVAVLVVGVEVETLVVEVLVLAGGVRLGL